MQDKTENKTSLNQEHQKIAAWMETVKFKKKIFGGLDEIDVWNKLTELNQMYDQALIAERARYDTLLKAQEKMTKDRLEKCELANEQKPENH